MPYVDFIDEDANAALQSLPQFSFPKTWIVTGATGLIGTHLIAAISRYFSKFGVEGEIIAVSLSESLDSWQSTPKQLQRVYGDVSDPSFCRALPAVDCVVHAAGYGQPRKFLEDPVKTFMLNTTGTKELLKKVKKDGRFLFISSSELYSGFAGNSCTESSIGTTTPEHPRAAYIEGKRSGEFLVHRIAQEVGMLAYCARVALAYGPGTRRDDKRVINELIRRGIVEGEVYLRDVGAVRRTYGYISDVTYLLLLVLLSGVPGTYNVGGKSETTISSLAELIAAICEVPFRIESKADGESADPSAPEVVGMDLNKTLGLGPEPNWVSLEDGLSRTIRWQRQVLHQ